jgi:hypothetical protein
MVDHWFEGFLELYFIKKFIGLRSNLIEEIITDNLGLIWCREAVFPSRMD